MNKAKENWLIAWSIIRTCRNEIFPRQTKEISKLLRKAQELIEENDLAENKMQDKKQLSMKIWYYLSMKKNFKKEWTGYKWTWVKKEPSDVPF